MSEGFDGVTMYPAAGCYQPADAPTIYSDPDIVLETNTIETQPQHSPSENKGFSTIWPDGAAATVAPPHVVRRPYR
jgi:hypothetical protein